MRRTEVLSLLSALCLGAGCATVPVPGGGAPERTSRPLEVMEAPPDPPQEAIAAYEDAARHREKRDYARMLESLDRALEIDPNYFEALHDKAWILATHEDPRVRNPEHALSLALKASTNLGKWGLLRPERDALPVQTSTGRHILVMGAIAGALASQGLFLSPPVEGLPADSAARAEQDALTGSMLMGAGSGGGGMLASAFAAQSFVVDATEWLAKQFPQSPDTGPAMMQAQHLMSLYSEGRAPIGEQPAVWGDTPITRLR